MNVSQYIFTKDSNPSIGGKASNLLKLEKLQIPIPKWGVIPSEYLTNKIDVSLSESEILTQIQDLLVTDPVIENIKKYFGKNFNTKTYAVRSSALDEDGGDFSFAGQFETFLHVPFNELSDKIKLIWQSTLSKRVKKYRDTHKLDIQIGIAVIIQEMISPDVSGVAFGADPVNFDADTKIIASVYGLGEGLVSGELNADNFTLTSGSIQNQLTKKEFLFVRDDQNNGIKKIAVEPEKQEITSLANTQILQIASVLDVLEKELKTPQDIEFAYVKDKLFLLQTRPITTSKGEYILWDNSNIIESYPGITTPLTFSFIIKMYEMVYRQFVGLMGVNDAEIAQHKEIFSNTLGFVRGRVYYNLLNWYKMLAMLPGYSINAQFMENMMGVKERFELKEDYKMSKTLARFRIFKMVFKMINLQRKLPKERESFLKHLNQVIGEYKAVDFGNKTIPEIIKYYNRFESTLLLKWKAPLINDFFAMIWFGLLQKQTQKYSPDTINIHNDLLLGSNDIVSVEPIYLTIEIANIVQQDKEAKRLFMTQDPDVIWKKLATEKFKNLKTSIDAYIDKFGERCVGELKLETVSYSQNPSLFIKTIKAYVKQGISKKTIHSNTEFQLRDKAEAIVFGQLKNNVLKKYWFTYILNKTRDLVSNRENLRYERTRGFGMVRTMFSAIGLQLYKAKLIANKKDVFYLKLDEIITLENQPFTAELKAKIALRKKEFENYKTQEPPQERFYTYGHNFTDAYIYSNEKIEAIEGDLKGIGASPGQVKGKVRVVLDPNEIESLNGDILVTSSTDPGWVTLFPTAAAILVERGSLLSHSAIVSREMGIPSIVGITGLLRTLKTGDEIIMNGSTGEIKQL